MTNEETDTDVGIIGGGPAGASMAAYLARAGVKCVVFESEIFGSAFRRHRAAAEDRHLTVPDGGLVSHFTGDNDDGGPLQSLGCADQMRWLRAMQPLEPLRFVHLASPTPLLFQGDRHDTLVPVKDFETVSNAASEPKQIKWYDAGHGLTSEAIRDQLEWLHTHVGTSSP